MRIKDHPILTFQRGNVVRFTVDGKTVEGYDNEPIAVALHDAGIKVLSHSMTKERPRGFFCAIGNCSSCMMTVNGEPNVKVCMELAQEGMVVETQKGKGQLL